MEVLPSKCQAPPAASARRWFSVRDVTFRGYSLERMEFVEGLGSAFQDLGFRRGLFGFRDQKTWENQNQIRSLSLYSSRFVGLQSIHVGYVHISGPACTPQGESLDWKVANLLRAWGQNLIVS